MNLVTGASGFLGGHVVDGLVARGDPIRALVRPSSRTERLEGLAIEVVYGSLEDEASLRRATAGAERVFHCAALVADWGKWPHFRSVNVTGLKHLLTASFDAGVTRFIHVSTSDVYGYPNWPVAEDAPFQRRRWPYGDTKIEGEELVWKFFRETGLPVTVIRPISVYGPRSLSLVLEVVNLLKKGEMLHVGGGHANAGLGYVTNVVDLMLRAAELPVAVGRAYNASDGTTHTWRDFVEKLADIVGVKRPRLSLPKPVAYVAGWAMERTYAVVGAQGRPLLTRMAVELLGTDQGFSINRARTDLGYRPTIDFDEGMQRVGLWLREIGAIERARPLASH